MLESPEKGSEYWQVLSAGVRTLQPNPVPKDWHWSAEVHGMARAEATSWRGVEMEDVQEGQSHGSQKRSEAVSIPTAKVRFWEPTMTSA